MEEILAQPAAQPTAPIAPAAVVTPPVAAAPPVQMQTPPPSYSGDSGESLMDTIKSLNPTEIFFGILGSAVLFYMIYYYKNEKANQLKTAAIQAKLDELVISQADLSGKIELLNANHQQQQNTGGFV